MGGLGMAVLLGVVVVLLLGGFFLAWHRDRKRSDDVASEPGRLHPERRRGDPA